MSKNANTPRRYNEYRVTILYEKGKPEIQSKVLTRRGHVSIHDHEAEQLNSHWERTGILYEPAKVEEIIDPERQKLFDEAASLGLKVAKNISTENLRKKIETFKS